MSINTYIESISEVEELVITLLKEEFSILESNAKIIFYNIKKHFDKLKDSSYLVVETNYVDKVYRDSYYHYYSSKLKNYKRDCIRISIFEGEVKEEEFWIQKKQAELQEKYRGYIVLRPTEPYIIGRSVISPKALKNNGFLSCLTNFKTTVNGVRFNVEGFPHSSQDTETISCAETTLWAIMEYFSNKYSDYKPSLPSKIIETLSKVSSERQIPSKGLNIAQMSYALKEFGFGTRIYNRNQYSDNFENLLSCYIESGIPLIIAMENRPIGTIGHALLAIGHEKIDDVKIDSLVTTTISNVNLAASISKKNIKFYDLDDVKKDLIFIDDNQPVYQYASIDNPAAHYSLAWQNCKITYFIVPLYPKIYLEAFEAKNYIRTFLVYGPEPLVDNSEVLIRFYLASSRSFKNDMAKKINLQEDFKSLLIETSMPKFIWVAEISNKDLMKQKLANGLIILDATEANISFNKPLIIAAYQGKIIRFDETGGFLQNISLPLTNFSIFESNLNPF